MNSLPQQSIYSLTMNELQDFLESHGHSRHLAAKLFQIWYKGNTDHQISHSTMDLIASYFATELPDISKTSTSSDGTVKFLVRFKDKKEVETVLIPFHKKYTVCLSSQVGCGMKCSFCYTGTMGLTRHLSAFEIIAQYLLARNYLKEHINSKAIDPNIVFMGQGEPLHNFDQVASAITIMTEPMGLGIGPRQMTLSTAGFMPGLLRFRELPSINLAVSLHSPFDHIRDELIPLNKTTRLERLLAELDQVPLRKRQFITYEYLLIDGLNDRLEDATELAKLLAHRKAIINLIPFNPYPESHYRRPSKEKVDFFKELLVEQNLRVMVRTTKGSEILAACGQLKTQSQKTQL